MAPSIFGPSICRSIDERTLVYFADNSPELLNAYAESGEGIDRAGGFAIQVYLILLSKSLEQSH